MSPEPYTYPAAPHPHRHAPQGYIVHSSYKAWLRDDHEFRCVYCLKRERWATGHGSFGVDHLTPVVLRPDLAYIYANLVYACNDCNAIKSDQSPPINPLREALANHLRVDAGGVAEPLSEAGEDWIAMFRLNSPAWLALRQQHFAVLRTKQRFPDDPDIQLVYHQAFGYPDDLPDLGQLRPPGGNANAGSEARSHCARRERGELPAVY